MADKKKKAKKEEAPKAEAPAKAGKLTLEEAVGVIDKMPLTSRVVRDNKCTETVSREDVLEILKRVK